MAMEKCEVCGSAFFGLDAVIQSIGNVCLSCYKKNKRMQEKMQDDFRNQDRVRQAYEQAKQEQARRDGRQYQPPPFQRPTTGPIPPDMLKRMIMLCHPDKHGNSEMSKTVTQWLLTQRK